MLVECGGIGQERLGSLDSSFFCFHLTIGVQWQLIADNFNGQGHDVDGHDFDVDYFGEDLEQKEAKGLDTNISSAVNFNGQGHGTEGQVDEVEDNGGEADSSGDHAIEPCGRFILVKAIAHDSQIKVMETATAY